MIALFIAHLVQAHLVQALLLQAATARAKPPAAMAVVRGKVVAEDTGAPLSYAAIELRRTSDQSLVRAFSNSSGAFEISGVEPGNYVLRAGKTGFVTAGYKNPDNDSSQLKLAAGDTKDVPLRLARGAVITGVVTDAMGEPVNGATVSLLRKVYSNGLQYTVEASTFTDDRGEYRSYNLAAGRYYLKVTKNVTPGGGGLPTAATFYPAARRQKDAQAIVVRAGDEREGANVTLQEAALYDAAGRVVDARTGEPMVNAYLNLMPAFGGGLMYNDRAQPDGAFHFRNVPAGAYRINVSAGYADRARTPVNTTRTVEINSNTNDLVIRVGAGATINGTLSGVGGAMPSGAMVILTQRSSDGSSLHTSAASVDGKGTFELAGIEPGTYEIAVTSTAHFDGSPAPTFVLTSAIAAFASSPSSAHDVTDTPIEIGDTDALVLNVTIDLSPATISGKVSSAEDNSAARVSVALVSADARKRTIYRYFHTASSKRDGSFELSGVAPGKYLLIPWPAEDPGQVLDPDVFPMVEGFATPVTIERGAKVTQDLRLTRALRTLADTFAQ